LCQASVTVSLERSPGSTPEGLEPLPAPGPGRARVMLANHRRANRFTVATAAAASRGGAFEARLEVPAKLPWPRLTLRVYAANASQEGLAVRVLRVADGKVRR